MQHLIHLHILKVLPSLPIIPDGLDGIEIRTLWASNHLLQDFSSFLLLKRVLFAAYHFETDASVMVMLDEYVSKHLKYLNTAYKTGKYFLC